MTQSAPFAPEATASIIDAEPAHHAVSRGYGLEIILWLLERPVWLLLALPTLLAAAAFGLASIWISEFRWLIAAGTWLAVPVCGVLIPLLLLVWRSYGHDSGPADWAPFVSFKDEKDKKRWQGKKVPMEIVYEAFMAGRLDFKQDLYETMLRRNALFRFCFTWGDVKFYFREFLGTNVSHSIDADRGDIAHVYNRGNDFYHWFLGDTMVYTSGIFNDVDETLEQAQVRKLATVCRYVQMKPGDRHLDIGSGWGPLCNYAAAEHGTISTGITLAEEQAKWARLRAEEAGVADRVRFIVDDYRNLPKAKWDKITCLEMAEHVGIKNFQKFLIQVNDMLQDDGIFYLQIAGLRRPWQYEDLVWGLFMAKYIFPGADASCPLGFVVSQAERAGFEVHRVENCGAHYGVTIHKWYNNWISNRDAIVEKYGERWFRMWSMFLAWSVMIGRQGSSTVFMITLTKNTKNDRSAVSPEAAAEEAFSRTERWIGNRPVATQQ